MKIFQPQAMYQIGKRSNQEDAIFPKLGNATENDRLFIVCDGMGGHESGEVASNSVCQSISSYLQDVNPDTFSTEDFKKALESAYDNLDALDKDSDNPRKMGTTLTFLYLGNNSVIIAHIGDSRVYQLRRHKKGTVSIVHRTEDHSLVNDLIKAEIITEEEAKTHPRRNVITRAIQPNLERCKATIFETKDVRNDDYFFLCSDGVLESIDDRILIRILESNASNEDKIEEIKKRCSENSKDNNSAYLIQIKEGLPIVSSIESSNEPTTKPAPINNSKNNSQVKMSQPSNPIKSGSKYSKIKKASIIGKNVGIIVTLVTVIGLGIWGGINIYNMLNAPVTPSEKKSLEQQNSPFLQTEGLDTTFVASDSDKNYPLPSYIKDLKSDEREDVMYLRDNYTWDRSHLKSAKYIAIFDHLRNGNMSSINILFYGFAPEYKNSYLTQIVNRYSKASAEQKAAFKAIVSKNSFNLLSALNELKKGGASPKKDETKAATKNEAPTTVEAKPTEPQPQAAPTEPSTEASKKEEKPEVKNEEKKTTTPQSIENDPFN